MDIYKITNTLNNKIYIGLTTKTYLIRYKEHKQLSKYSNYSIHRAMRKYGLDSFKVELIEQCETIEELIKKESFWIKTLDSMNPLVGYNMINQEQTIKVLNDEVREKLSLSQIARLKKIDSETKKEIYIKSSISKQGKLRKNKKIRLIGVFQTKNGRFVCEVAYLKTRYRRTFLTETEAAVAYDKLVLFLYGKHARLNFKEDIDKYLKEDLILFVDWFLTHEIKQGRPAKKLYKYHDLIDESKKNAIKNIEQNKVLNIIVPELEYFYDGSINPDFLLKYKD